MIELDRLLQPISAERPSGVNLRLSAGDRTFRQIEELRREADPLTDPGGEAKRADWKGLVRECSTALTERSKDLELAAYLTLGWIREEGYAGLQTGLRLIRELIERFWDTLYPGYEDGEIITAIRARPLSMLGTAQEFVLAVKQVPVAGAVGETPRSWFDYELSRRVDDAGVRSDQTAYREMVEAGLITGEQWRAALQRTPTERLAAAISAIRGCQEDLERLRSVCAERFGEDAPHLEKLAGLLTDCAEHLRPVAEGQSISLSQDAAPAQGMGDRPTVPVHGGAVGPITTRDQAYRQLREIAEFLRRTEPHSPVAPLLDRAVKWGGMSFESLVKDVVRSEDARQQIGELLGLKPADQS